MRDEMPSGDRVNPEEGQQAGPPTRLVESGRVEAFSDGVLAIAITLLALDLKAPSGRPGMLLQTLLDQWPAYMAYLASFLYIGVIWVNHHALFTHIRRVDSLLLYLNLFLLLPASLLPFPTATLAFALQHGNAGDQHAAIVFYGLTAIIMGVTWLVIFAYLASAPQLLEADVPPNFFGAERRRAVLGMLSPLLAIAIGFVNAPVALVVFLILVIFYGLTTNGLGMPRT